MRRNWWGIALSMLLVLGVGAAWAEEPPTKAKEMKPGMTEMLKVKSVTKFAVSDKSVIRVTQTGGDEFRIVASGPGYSVLTIWDEAGKTTDYEYVVKSKDPNEVKDEVSKLLKEVGLTITVVGEFVVIDGDILTDEDLDRVNRVAGMYGQVRVLAKLDRTSMAKPLADRLRKRIGIDTVTVDIVDSKVLLGGSVNTAAERSQIEALVKTLYPNFVNNIQLAEKMIEIDVTILDVNRERNRLLGDQILQRGFSLNVDTPWLYWIQGILKTPTVWRQTITGAGPGNVNFRYNWNQQDVVTLQRGSIATINGKQGKWHVGQQIPIPVVTANTTDVKYKDVGFILTVTPTVYASGQVYLNAEVELSGVDAATGNINTTRATSEGLVMYHDTLVIGNVVQLSRNLSTDKVPVAGDIPLLNLLFKRDNRSRENRDVLVCLTPTDPTMRSQPDYVSLSRALDTIESECERELLPREHWERPRPKPYVKWEHIGWEEQPHYYVGSATYPGDTNLFRHDPNNLPKPPACVPAAAPKKMEKAPEAVKAPAKMSAVEPEMVEPVAVKEVAPAPEPAAPATVRAAAQDPVATPTASVRAKRTTEPVSNDKPKFNFRTND